MLQGIRQLAQRKGVHNAKAVELGQRGVDDRHERVGRGNHGSNGFGDGIRQRRVADRGGWNEGIDGLPEAPGGVKPYAALCRNSRTLATRSCRGTGGNEDGEYAGNEPSKG